jgi:putative membrane-bound dehydrogenase-like protein
MTRSCASRTGSMHVKQILSRLRCGLPGLVILCALLLHGDEPARTGPATEKRFPPLQVPAGFKATLFACDPLIEYPSVIAAGPRPGAVFVAYDYMTGLGTDIVRRDEIRLVEDTDGDGYADKSTLYAGGFNSIMGLAYHAGTVYVMHAPYLTALRDTKGSGAADERRDLLSGLGLTPEKNPVRLHCANGVTVGHDGWLYLSMGDNGVDVQRPEGDRLVLQEGGILRCRPDGRDLHVFAAGLRNIYDVALDDELNVFVRDNENDGGTYMIRVCHSFHGADHGYPSLYTERPDEALTPLADLGRGSSAGGVCYLETHLPPEYRGDLFFCEWGRSLVRYQPRRAGSSLAPLAELPFAEGSADDPYGFKPTDVVVQHDGTLLVADWCDGQRPKRGRGRIYHIAHQGSKPTTPRANLDSPSYYARCDAQEALVRRGDAGLKELRGMFGGLGVHGRLHGVWALAQLAGAEALDELLLIARNDAEPAVRAQAVRVIADLADPVLTQHRLDAGPRPPELGARLAELADKREARLLREVTIALGRLRWPGTPAWLRQHLGQPDTALAHAAQQALRRSGQWSETLALLDLPDEFPLRQVALRSLAERHEPAVVDGLIARLQSEQRAARRREYADLLSRVHKKPGPWTYWGYRPGPRPAPTVAWERTDGVAQALSRALADPDTSVRLFVLERMRREKVPLPHTALLAWLDQEKEPQRVAALLAALREQPAPALSAALERVVRHRGHSLANRRAALDLYLSRPDTPAGLLSLAEELEDGPLLADLLRRCASYPKLAPQRLLKDRLASPAPSVRAAAIAALGDLRAAEGRSAVASLLHDASIDVRRAAASAAGKLQVQDAAETLLKLARDPDAELRRVSLDSLRLLRDPRALPIALASLADRSLELTALDTVAVLGGPEDAAAVVDMARRTPAAEIHALAVRTLSNWRPRTGPERDRLDEMIARLQGDSGILLRWHAEAGPTRLFGNLIAHAANWDSIGLSADRTLFARGPEGRLVLAPKSEAKDVWLAFTDMAMPAPTAVEFLASSNSTLRVWLNGKKTYERADPRAFQLDSDRFAANLNQGPNRVLVETTGRAGAVEFHLRFRRKSERATHEKLIQAALGRTGNVERGRKLFHDVNKSLCLKCHQLGNEGEKIGPELTGVGSRFSRIHLVESILEPSRSIAPSYGSHVLTLKDGRILTGIKVADTSAALTLADNQGQKHVVPQANIEALQPSPLSTMPDNLEQRLSEAEFVDLIAFLESQKGPGR